MTELRTTSDWVDYLKNRCQTEGVDCWLTNAEIYGWVNAGVSDGDDEDDVFAAFCEMLADED